MECKAVALADLADATAGLTAGREPEATPLQHIEQHPRNVVHAFSTPSSAPPAPSNAAGGGSKWRRQRDGESHVPNCSLSKDIEAELAAVSEEQNHSTSLSARTFVVRAATRQCPRMERVEIETFVAKPRFGERLCGHRGVTASVYNRVAQLALPSSLFKDTALESKLWSLCWQSDEWLRLPINLRRRCDREHFLCTPDIYDYAGAPAGTLVVDFANKHIGGGCFGRGFVQEEQMVMQSTDFAARLHEHRQKLSWHQGISYEGVYMDAWWPRAAAAKKDALDLADIQHCISNPLTILTVDAPKMHSDYCQDALQMLTAKVLLIFAAAEDLHSPQIFSGLLGGGAFRNN